MSIRNEVLECLKSDIGEKGAVLLKDTDRETVHDNLNVARKSYQEARREFLRHQLGRYYRVVIFGSARLGRDSDDFRFVTELTTEIVKAIDADIVTGGGPGIMEAALMGAQLAIDESKTNGHKRLNSRNHGVTINLVNQEAPNGYIHFATNHPDFSTRLQEFIDKTQAAYIAPGGIGTTLELLYLMQTRQVSHLELGYPVVAHPFWRPVVDSLNDQMYHNRIAEHQTPMISRADLDIIQFSDDIPEIVSIYSASHASWRSTIRDHVRIIRSLR